jgi:hypothetical protein
MVNNRGYILHKVSHKEGRRRHDYDVYKKNHPVTPKQVLNVVDLGYIGIEKDFPEQPYHPYRKERRQTKKERAPKEKKKPTKVILKRE